MTLYPLSCKNDLSFLDQTFCGTKQLHTLHVAYFCGHPHVAQNKKIFGLMNNAFWIVSFTLNIWQVVCHGKYGQVYSSCDNLSRCQYFMHSSYFSQVGDYSKEKRFLDTFHVFYELPIAPQDYTLYLRDA